MNPSVITRANQNSSLYQTIKARNSKQDVFDYNVSGEKNICEVARSKVIVNSTSTMNATGQQTLKFELPNYGLLEDLYLKTKFTSGTAGQNVADGSKGIALTNFAGAFAWTKCRLVFQGTTIFEWTPEWVMTSQYTRATRERAGQLNLMLGGDVIGVENNSIASRTGRRLISSCAGGIELMAPLKAFWSDSLGRAFDLYSLNSKVHLEVDYRSNALAHEEIDDADMASTYAGAELVCYLAELSPEALSAYQSRNYVPGSVSSQLGFTTTHFSELVTTPVLITGTSTTGNRIKLNSISGLVRRLYIFANLEDSETAKKYFEPQKIARIRLLANNQVIHEQEEFMLLGADDASTSNGYKTDGIVEMFRNNLPMSFGDSTALPAAADAKPASVGGGSEISRVCVVNFGYSPDDYSSADGSVSFSQMNNIELEIFFGSEASTNNHNVHIVAEMLTANTYNVSSTGAITFKSIGE